MLRIQELKHMSQKPKFASEVMKELTNLQVFFPLHHYLHTITCKWLNYFQLKTVKYSLRGKRSNFSLRKNVVKIPYTGILLAAVNQVHGSGSTKKYLKKNADPQHCFPAVGIFSPGRFRIKQPKYRGHLAIVFSCSMSIVKIILDRHLGYFILGRS
jgi:hypothetical protein